MSYLTVKLLREILSKRQSFLFLPVLFMYEPWNFHIGFKSVKHCCIYTSATLLVAFSIRYISGGLRLSPPPLRSLQLPAPAYDSAPERGNNWWKYHLQQYRWSWWTIGGRCAKSPSKNCQS